MQTARQRGQEIAAAIEEIYRGRAITRINGQTVHRDSKQRFYIHDQGTTKSRPLNSARISATALGQILSDKEVDDIKKLSWNGSNSYEISTAIVNVIEIAIERQHQ